MLVEAKAWSSAEVEKTFSSNLLPVSKSLEDPATEGPEHKLDLKKKTMKYGFIIKMNLFQYHLS